MDGVAWTDAGIDQTFDNIDQHEQDFTEIVHTYGYNDAVRRFGVNNYVIEIGGEEVEFSFANGQLVPVASQWQQGATPMFYYRTLNDGTNDVTVVCDADGKLCVIENDGYLIKGQNGYAWSIGAAPQALVTNAGGKVTMTAYTDEDETTVISMNGYTVVIDLDGLVTVGAITAYGVIPVSGKVQIFANEDCTAYATGTVNKVYARINEDINEAVQLVFDPHDQSDPTKRFKFIVAQGYYTTLDWELSSQTETIQFWGQGQSTFPIAAGVYELTKSGDATDVTNWNKVFSNE